MNATVGYRDQKSTETAKMMAEARFMHSNLAFILIFRRFYWDETFTEKQER